MRKWLIIFIFAISGPILTEAAVPDLPQNPCGGRGCSLPMLKAVDKFMEFAPVESGIPTVYSGECHHAGRGYDPEKIHHGMFLLSPHPERPREVSIAGRFSFFVPQNPYREWTVERALEELPHPYKTSIGKSGDFSYADFSDGSAEQIWGYFLSHDRDENVLYVIGYWSVFHILTCQLYAN